MKKTRCLARGPRGHYRTDRWSGANSPTAAAFRVGYPQRHLLPLFQKTLKYALIQETLHSLRRRRGLKDRPPLNLKMVKGGKVSEKRIVLFFAKIHVFLSN